MRSRWYTWLAVALLGLGIGLGLSLSSPALGQVYETEDTGLYEDDELTEYGYSSYEEETYGDDTYEETFYEDEYGVYDQDYSWEAEENDEGWFSGWFENQDNEAWFNGEEANGWF